MNNPNKFEIQKVFLFWLGIFSVCSLFILGKINAFAANDGLKEKLEQIQQKSGFKDKELSLLIVLHERGVSQEVFSVRADQLMVPASLTKILTAGMSLEKYPIGLHFVTELRAEKQPENSILSGNLYLRGGGDPGFVSESMWYLVNEFVRTGIKQISGDIVVDDQRFDQERFSSGRDPSRVDRAYDAPIGAMSFNWNTVNIFVRPGKKPGDPAFVYADPENDYIQPINKAMTGKEKSKHNITVSRKANGLESDKIVISGTIPLGSSETVIYKSILHPEMWSGFNLRSFLQKRGIEVKGSVRAGSVSLSSSVVLAKAESKPIGLLVTDMMKFSNNFVAEMLVKNLAAELTEGQGTMEKGVQLLNQYVIEKGFAQDKFELTSPSGLSRKNQLSSRQLLKILEDLRVNFTVFPEFLSSLPILGVDGTLKSRLSKSTVRGWVRAKTGMLTGVTGLAGYAGRLDGGMATFVFLFNGTANKTTAARKLFDDLAKELVK